MTPARGMDPAPWVPADARSVLDVGCNVGELLSALAAERPGLRLAGCDVNSAAVAAARRNVPAADVRDAGAAALPFPDAAFDCVTCVETLEHVAPADWRLAMAEMTRVLAPGGRLVVRTPHAGLFAFLDTNNVRFRLPGVYRRLVGRGRRDAGYADGSAGVHWHHHFTRAELVALAGPGLRAEATWYGGLLVFPLGDYLLWPFYRKGWNGPVRRLIERVREADYAVNYGPASYGVLVAFRKPG